MRKNDPKLLCWQCNKQLYQSYATIEFNGSQIKVHHTCKKDAENLLLRNKPTFQGEFNPSNDELVEFEDVEVIAQTDKAILCRINGDEKWIPQSQVHDNSEIWNKGDEGTLVVTLWWAVKAGLV